MESYESLSADERRALAPMDKLSSMGVEASREMVAWLWNNRVAAIGTDCPAVEAFPIDFADEGALHYRALPLLGLPLGELFVLAPLAEDCAQDRRYEFMLVSAPLHLEGGIASPPTPSPSNNRGADSVCSAGNRAGGFYRSGQFPDQRGAVASISAAVLTGEHDGRSSARRSKTADVPLAWA